MAAGRVSRDGAGSGSKKRPPNGGLLCGRPDFLVRGLVEGRFSRGRVRGEEAREGGGEGRGVCAHIMHGRSRMIVYPSIPTMSGRSAPGLRRLDRHRLHHARSAVRCLANHVRGRGWKGARGGL